MHYLAHVLKTKLLSMHVYIVAYTNKIVQGQYPANFSQYIFCTDRSNDYKATTKIMWHQNHNYTHLRSSKNINFVLQ